MMRNEKIAIGLYIILSLIAIIVLIVLIVKKKKCGEGFKKCLCTQESGGRSKVCSSINAGYNAYMEDGVTETNPNWKQPKWTTIFPGDYDFPETEGCGFGTTDKEEYTYTENQANSGEVILKH